MNNPIPATPGWWHVTEDHDDNYTPAFAARIVAWADDGEGTLRPYIALPFSNPVLQLVGAAIYDPEYDGPQSESFDPSERWPSDPDAPVATHLHGIRDRLRRRREVADGG